MSTLSEHLQEPLTVARENYARVVAHGAQFRGENRIAIAAFASDQVAGMIAVAATLPHPDTETPRD